MNASQVKINVNGWINECQALPPATEQKKSSLCDRKEG